MMSTPFMMNSGSFSLPHEEDIDLASLLVSDRTARGGDGYPEGSKSPSFSRSRIGGASPSRRSLSGNAPPAHAHPSPHRAPADKQGGQRVHATPPVSHHVFENSSDTVSRHLSGHNLNHAPNVTRASSIASHSPGLGNGASDLFVSRECFLVAADFSKNIADALLKLERSVERDGIFDTKVVESIYPQRIDYREVQGSPKESSVLRETLLEVTNRANKLLVQLALNQETANKTYHNQLKKMREVCNQSIRSAIQADRAQNGAHMTQMKEIMEVERDRALSDIKRELNDYQHSISNLKAEVQRLHESAEEKEDERSMEKRRHQDHLEELEATHRQELRAQHNKFAGEKEKIEQLSKEEITRLKQYVEEEKKRSVEEHDALLKNHRTHDAEIRDMLNSEIERLKTDFAQCRDQLIVVTAQASTERDKLLKRFDDEKRAMESEFQKSQAEGVQSLARIRGEVADRVRRLQEEDKRRKEAFEEIVEKERGELVANHILELDELEDKHRKDMRRLEAQLEVRYGDETSKLRKVHEQEVKRLISDNDRLHRSLLAKSKVIGTSTVGGMQQLKADLDASNIISRRAQGRTYTPSLSGGRVPGSSFTTTRKESPSPSRIVNEKEVGETAFSADSIYGPELSEQELEVGKKSWYTSPNRFDKSRRPESPPPPPPKSPHSHHKPISKSDSPIANVISPTTPFASMRDSGASDGSNQHQRFIDGRVDAGDRKSEKINWGALQDSLDMQEGRKKTAPRNADSDAIPDSFVLEEALQNAKYSGHNVTTTANAVGSYMNKLQSYLEGSDADTLSDGSMQRHLASASEKFFGSSFRLQEGNKVMEDGDISYTSDDSLECT